MSSLTFKNGFRSPLEYISKLVGNSFDKFLTRKFNEVKDIFSKIQELESKHLEQLNQYNFYKIEDLDNFEKEIQIYREINELFRTLSGFIDDSKSKVEPGEEFYTDLVLLNNQIHDLNETLHKVTDKLSAILNKILIKQSETMSSDILKDLWKDEEDIWDNFHKKSQP